MARKTMVVPPIKDEEDDKRAFNICLLEPVNYTIHETSDQIGVILDLLKKTKNKEEFQRTLIILIKMSENQAFLATSTLETVRSMLEKPEDRPKVH